MHVYVVSTFEGVSHVATFSEARAIAKAVLPSRREETYAVLCDVDTSKAGVLKILNGAGGWQVGPNIKHWQGSRRGGLQEMEEKAALAFRPDE